MTAKPARAPSEEALCRDLWQDILEKDDRTSPEEYPDMGLITYDEFAENLRYFAAHRLSTSLLNPSEEVVDWGIDAMFKTCHDYAGNPKGWDNAIPREIAVLLVRAVLRAAAMKIAGRE